MSRSKANRTPPVDSGYRFNLFKLPRYLKEELFILLGTASSESVLPALLKKLERLGCSMQAVGLVLPTGYSFNLDGTGMFLALSVAFLSNSSGVYPTVAQQGRC
jgi:aerobic C4-dicarboxylate transport protein